MGFPNDVRTSVLTKCKRHCCLCGQYAGTYMELHHIRQKADGGDDTEENCMPLCFNCHAEVKSYNPHHPKGLKYNEQELKERRNQVYQFVKNKVICNYSNDDIDKAKKLLNNYYKQIEAIISIDPCANPVNISLIDYVNNMILELQSYAFVFSNEEVENQKCNLVETIQEWCDVMQNNEYFHPLKNGFFLCFNSNSVDKYRERMYVLRTKIKDYYCFLKGVSANRVI